MIKAIAVYGVSGHTGRLVVEEAEAARHPDDL
jgi:hypothetical protein